MRHRVVKAVPTFILALGVVIIGTALPASAATVEVTTNEDEVNVDGDCSIREAVEAANTDAAVDACAAGSGPDVITFAASTNGSPVVSSTTLDLANVTVQGNGAGNTTVAGDFNVNNATAELHALTIDAGTDQALNVNSGFAGASTTFTMTDSTIIGDVNINSGFSSTTTATFNGVTGSGADFTINSGFDNSQTVVTITSSSLQYPFDINASADSDTTATFTASTVLGVEDGSDLIDTNLSVVSLTNSTVSGDDDVALELSGSQLTAVNSTIAANAGGIDLEAGSTATLTNTILANTGDECVSDPVTSSGGNIADDDTCGLSGTGDQQGVDPQLGALGDNGGPTETHLPAAGSPAVDGGIAAGCPGTDQRGVARPQDGNEDGTAVCDSGSVELSSEEPPTTTTTTTTTTTPGGTATTAAPGSAPAATPVSATPRFTG